MAINLLEVTNVRNLQKVYVSPSPSINIIYGDNGSGKTSLLEAIHLLSVAKSFRTNSTKPLIQYNTDSCSVFAKISSQDCTIDTSIGVSRQRNGRYQIKLDGESIDTIAALASHLPVQLINADCFELLSGSPKDRRRFLDKGVFHVKPTFIDLWKKLQRCLKHRNQVLRHDIIDKQLLAVWDAEFISCSEQIHQQRQWFIDKFKPLFILTLSELIELDGIDIEYYAGWNVRESFDSILSHNLRRDQAMRGTQYGPQRADLRFLIQQMDAVDILSRGQQKLLVSALLISQGILLQEYNKQCIYLIDDLPAELDKHYIRKLCQLIASQDNQLFITCTDPTWLVDAWQNTENVKLFHVKHGELVDSSNI